MSPRRAEASRRRRIEVTSRIQRAALGLMDERGYQAVTVEDVAAAASVSPRTFFRHFACKDDVVLHLERLALVRICDGIRRRPAAEGAVEALHAAVLTATRVGEGDRELVLLHARVLAAVPTLQAQALGEQCVGTGPLARAVGARMGLDPGRDPRPALVAASVAATTSVTFARWAAGGGVGDPTAVLAAALAAVIAGVDAVMATTPLEAAGGLTAAG